MVTSEWVATMFANFALAALLISCRPERMRLVWLYVGASLFADWFWMGATWHLTDSMKDLPWMALELSCIACESVALIALIFRPNPCRWCSVAVAGTMAHVAARFTEWRVWETYAGRWRYRLELNPDGWRLYYLRQDLKIVSALALGAYILRLRYLRDKEDYVRSEVS